MDGVVNGVNFGYDIYDISAALSAAVFLASAQVLGTMPLICRFVADLGNTAPEAASESFSNRRFRSARDC